MVGNPRTWSRPATSGGDDVARGVHGPAGGAGVRREVRAAAAGASVGVLGGTIGLGGAEFRLPLLIGVFGFAALQAVVLN
jgi:hypothetical protein